MVRPKKSRVAAKPKRRAPLLLALEPRLMFDGAIAASTHAIVNEHHDHVLASGVVDRHAPVPMSHISLPTHGQAPATSTAPQDASSTTQNVMTPDRGHGDRVPGATGPAVVFIDSRVEDAATLINGVVAGTEIVYLQPDKNGLQQISSYLAHHHEVSSVEIIAHGSDGQLQLGDTDLNAANIQTFAGTLAGIGKNLQAGADILVYACNTAQDARGVAFVNALARDTGHVVAASSNITGAGGDWKLEIATGTVTAATVLSAAAEAHYGYALTSLTAATDAQLQTAIGTADADALGNDTITLTADITFTSAADTLSIVHPGTGVLTIDGGGHTIDANYLSRVLTVTSGRVVLENLTITHGLVAAAGGANSAAGGSALGAGITNAGNLTLYNVNVTNNFASGGGGGGGGGLQSLIAGVNASGGGGGGGVSGKGGAAGGAGTSGASTVSGGAASGATGGSGGASSHGGSGIGGSAAGGGAGGVGTTAAQGAYASGASGATATAGGFTIGGGGGGSGRTQSGGAGGSAAGGIYNSGVLYVAGTSAITNNAAAGGGGGGGGGLLTSGGNGGQGVGGIMNSALGTVKLTSNALAAMTGNVGVSGAIGSVVNSGSNALVTQPTAYSNINASGFITTNYSPAVVTSITRVGAASNNGTSEQYTVTFSQAVTGVNTLDFALSNTGTAGGLITGVSGSGTTYTVTVGTVLGDGTMRLDLVNNPLLVVDSNGNPVLAGFTGGQSYTLDHTAPIATSINTVGATTNGAASEQYTINFSENVTGVSTNAFTLVTTGTAQGTISSVTGSGTTYTVNISGVSGNGLMQLNLNALNTGITDSVGNALGLGFNTGQVYTLQHTAPTVTSITTVGNSSNNGTSEQYTVNFSENVAGVVPTDFVLTNAGTAGGVISAVTGSGSSYTVTVTPAFGDGTMRLDVNSNAPIVDAAGNTLSTGYSSGQVYTLDHTAPFATQINTVGASPNNASSEQFTVVFSEAVTAASVTTSAFTLVNTGTVQGTIAAVSGSGNTYTVTVNNVSGNGTMQLDLNLAGTGITDLVGNPIAGGFLTGQPYTLQHTAPAVTSIVPVTTGPSSALTDQYTVNFSEPVTGVTAADFHLTTTGTASGLITAVSGSGSTYTVTVGSAVGDGTMRLDLNSVVVGVTDAAGNSVTGGYSSGTPLTVDHTAPVATGINTVGASTNNASSEQFTVQFSENVTGVSASAFSLVNTGTASGTIASVAGSGSTYTVTVNNVNGDGTMQLALNALNTGITDTAGNAVLGGFLTGQAYTLRHTGPSVSSIVPVTASPTNALTDQYTVTFNEAVTGVDLTDFHLTNTGTAGGVITAVTGSGSTYTVTVGSVLGDGTTRLDLNSALTGIADAAGNGISGGYSSGTPLIIDHTSPYATGINVAGSPTNNGSTEQFTVQFSENVTGVDTGDFTLATTGTAAGTIASVTGSGSAYTVTVNNVTGNGTMQLNLNALNTGITDTAGNAIIGGFLTGQVYNLQHTAPSVTSIVPVGSSPNNALSDQFTVTFSENVTGVDLTDFHLTDTGTASGVITGVTGSGNVYTVTVAPALGDGTIRLDVNSLGTGIADAAGNAFTGGYAAGTPITVDHTAPYATAINTVGASPNSNSTEQFTVQFSENVTGVDVSDFTLVNTGTVNGSIASVTGSGSTYTVTVNNVNGDGTMALALNAVGTGITDSAGNAIAGGFATGQIYTLRHTAPAVTAITPLNGSPNNAASEQYTVQFSENVVGVDITDFHLTDTGTAGGVILGITGSGSTYTVTVAPAVGDGTMRLDLNSTGTGIVDYAGNGVTGGYSSGGVVTLDHTAPVVTSINTVGANPNNASSEQFTVNFSESVSGVDSTDFTLVNTGTVNGSIASVTGSGSTYTVTVNNVNGNGTMQLALNAVGTGIVDAAGNANIGGYALGQIYTLQHTAPVVTSITAVGGTGPSNTLAQQYTVTFSENVVGVDALDFHLTDTGTAGGVISAVTGSGSVYTVTVAPTVGDGTMRLDLNSVGTGIVDYSGNSINGGFTGGQVVALEHTPPTATSITLLSPNPTSATSDQFQVNFSENVTGVDASDFTLLNAGTVGGTVSSVTGSGSTYTVTVSNVVGTGTMALSLNAVNTGIVDTAGNALVGGGLSSAYTVTGGPGVTSIAPLNPSPNNSGTEVFTVNFNTAVTGVDAGDFSLTDTGTASGTIASVSGAGSVYTVTVNGASGDGTMRLDLNASGTGIADLSGTAVSAGFTSGTAVTLDHTGPSVTAIVPSSPTTDGNSETYTVNFSESVVGVNAADFTLTNTGTATGVITNVTGSGSTYTVTVSGVTGDGTSRLDLNANAPIVDLAGNLITGGYTGGTVNVDHTPPTVTSITRVGTNPNNASSDQYTVTFSEAVTGVDAGDFALTNTGSAAGTISTVTGSGNTYTVTVSNVSGDGTMRLDLNSSGTGISDVAGNSISGGYTSGQAYTIEHTPPSVTAIALVGPSPNNAGSDQYTVTFSENVTGVDAADFALTNSGSVTGTVTNVSGSGNTYVVTVGSVSGDGTMRLDLKPTGTGIADAAGNGVTGGYTAGASYTIEHTPPSVASIALVGASTNNAGSEQYTVTFSENVTGVDAGDFALTTSGNVGGTISSVTGSGSTYIVTVSNVTGDGTMRLDLKGSGTGISDAAGNTVSGGYTAGPLYTIEHTPPSVTAIGLVGANPNNSGSEQFTVTFSENVSGVDISDFALTNSGSVTGTIASITGSGSSYTVTVNNVTGDGTMRLDLNASGTGITDAAGNSIAAGYTTGPSYTLGHSGPVVSSIATVGANPSNAGSEQFNVTFSENVTGVDATDFALATTGSAAGTIASVTPTGTGNTYTVTVNNVTGDGTMRLDLNANGTGIADASGNAISGGYTAGASYTIEHTPPSVTAIAISGSSPNHSSSEQFTVTFSENVTGVDASDFALTTTGNVAGTIASVSPTGASNTYTITVNNVTGDGTMRLDLNPSGTGITDAAGNSISGGYIAGGTYTIEHTPPSVTSIATVGPVTNNAGSEQFTVSFSENVTGVDASDFALTTGGNVSGSISSVTGSGNTYTVTVGNVTGDGTMRLDLNSSGTGIADAAGNSISGGYTAGGSYTIEHTPPSVTSISLANANPNFNPTEQFTVTFSENVTGVDAGDFALTTAGNVTGAISSVTGSGNTYTVTVSGVSGVGTMRLDLNASGTGIADAAGNSIGGGYTGGATYVIGQTAPVVTSVALVNPATNNANSEQFTVTFSENVSGVNAGDFTLTNGGTVAGTITSVTGSGSAYTVTATGVTGDGSMRLDVNGSGTTIQNVLLQPLASGYNNGPTYTIEHTPPSVASITLVGATPNNAGSDQFTVTFSENVTGVDAGDFTLTNGGSVAGTIASVSGSGNTYVVTANNVTGDGTMRLDLNAMGTGIVDAAGNAIAGGYNTGPNYVIEHTAPSITAIALVNPQTNNSGSEQFTVTFSEAVTGVDAADFVLSNTGSVAGNVTTVLGSGTSYVVTVNNVTGDGTMRLDLNASGTGITDAAGNAVSGGYTTGPTYTIEHTAPVVSAIALVGAGANNASSDQYTVTFSESVSGVDAGDFALTPSGTAAGTISSVTTVGNSGNTYLVTVNNVTGDGTLRLDVNPSGTGIADATGNALAGGYTAGPAYTIEHTPPSLTSIATVGATTNNATSETYTVTFSENVSGVDAGDFALTTTGSATGTIASVTPTGSGNSYTVTVNNVTGTGTLRLDLNPSGTGITDAAGNAISGGYTSGGAYTINQTPPSVASIATLGATTNNAGSEQFTVTFSEHVAGVDAGDFALTTTGNVSGAITSVTPTGSGNAYMVTVGNVTGDGTMRLDLNPSGTGITDAAGNSISGGYTAGGSYTIEHTPPSVTSIALANANPNFNATEQFTVTFSENVNGVDASDFALSNSGTVAGGIQSVSGSGNTYTVTVGSVSGIGTMRLDLNAAGTAISDAAGNSINGGFTAGATYTIGQTAPVVNSIALVGPATNNANSESYTVTFSENVTGVDASDFTLTNGGTAAGTITSVTGSGSTYTVTATGVTGDGTMRLDLNASGTGISNILLQPVAGGYTNGPSYSIEHTPPSVTSIALVGPSANNASSEQFTVTFSENVTGVDASDFALTNGGTAAGTIASVSGSGNTYVVTANSVAGDGTMRLDLNGAGTGITDAAGNVLSSGYTSGPEYTLRHTAPVVSSISLVGQSPNNSTTDLYTVTFSESVTGVDAGDFTLTPTGGVGGTIASVTGSGNTYTVGVNNVSGDGTLRLDVNNSGTGIADAAGNPLSTGYQAGPAYTIQHTAPSVSSIATVGATTNNSGTETFTVTFSENVNGVDASDFALTNTGTAAGTISSVSGSGNVYTVTVNNVTGDGTMRLDLNSSGSGIMDAAGNTIAAGFTNGGSYTIEHTAPTVSTINTVGANPNNAGTELFTVTFSQPVTGVDVSDFVLSNTGTVSGNIASLSGSGNTYTLTVNNVVGDGTMRLDLNPSGTGIADSAGNGISGGFTGGEAYVIGHTAPVISSIATVGNASNNASTETFTVTFNENVSGVDVADFALTNTGTATGTITSVTGSGNTYTVTVGNVSGDGTMRLDLNSSGTNIVDANGNVITGAYTNGQRYTISHTAPAVTSVVAAASSPNNASSETFTVNFSENVSGVDASDFLLTNTGTAAGTISSVTGSGHTYTITVSNVSGDGTMRLDLNGTGTPIVDASGNVSAPYSSGQAITLDHTAPVIDSVVVAGANPTDGNTVQYTVTFSENVTGVDAGDFVLSATGTAAGTIASVTGSGHVYTITVNNVSGDGTLALALKSAGTGITDAAGNAVAAGATTAQSATVDHTAPTLTALTPVDAGPNNASTETFNVTFSEDVSGVNVGDFVLAQTGTAAGTITAVSGSGRHYIVTLSNVTGDGTLAVNLNGTGPGIVDTAGNAMNAGFTAGAAVTVNHSDPAVVSVSAPADGTYKTGETLDFTVRYDEPVFVDTSTGVPYINLTLANGTVVRATYVSGSGTDALVFQYTPALGDAPSGGLTIGSTVQPNGGHLTDDAGNAAGDTLANTAPTTGVMVDAVPPTVSSISNGGTQRTNGDTVTYTVTFSENVTGVDASDFTVTGTGSASGTVSSVTRTDANTYVVTVSNVSGDGTIRLDLNPQSSNVTDTAGNPASAGFSAGDTIIVDHTDPTVLSVSGPANGTYVAGQSLDYTVTYSEAVTVVTVNGVPELQLTFADGSTHYATYVSGSGTNTITFSYTVAPADLSAGVGVVSAVVLNGGTISDLSGNTGSLALAGVAPGDGVIVSGEGNVTGMSTFDAANDFPPTEANSTLSPATGSSLLTPASMQTDLQEFIRNQNSTIGRIPADSVSVGLNYPTLTQPVDSNFVFTVPVSSFQFDPGVVVNVQALLTNGSALPGWLSFDPSTGKFEGHAPLGWTQPLDILISARDQTGHEVMLQVQLMFNQPTADNSAAPESQRALHRAKPGETQRDAARLATHATRGTAARIARGNDHHHGKSAGGKPSLTDQFSRYGQSAQTRDLNALTRRVS